MATTGRSNRDRNSARSIAVCSPELIASSSSGSARPSSSGAEGVVPGSLIASAARARSHLHASDGGRAPTETSDRDGHQSQHGADHGGRSQLDARGGPHFIEDDGADQLTG